MKMYVYRFELEDGSTVEYKTQGLFSNTTEDLESRRLIKSASIIDEFEQDDAIPTVDTVQEVGQVIEQAE
jgi:hypothetical protein